MDVNPGSGGNYNPNSPPQYPHRRPSWFTRNWLWFVPLTLAVVASPFVCCGGAGFFAYKAVGAPFTACVEQLNETAEVTARLGSPIKKSEVGFVVNDMNIENGNGNVTLGRFAVDGPDGTANVSGVMKQFGGVWSMEEITVEFEDGTTIVLPVQD